MSVKRIFTAILPALLLLAFSSDRYGSAQTSEKLSDPQFIAEGAKLFATNCGNAYCHGSGGLGGGAPQLRDRGIPPASAFKSISNGISGTPMPAFKSVVSEEQIWKLVAFILSDAKAAPGSNGASADPSPIRSSPFLKTEAVSPASSVGDEKAGRALFFDSSRPKNCSSCHAFNGEGTAIGPDLSAAAANKSARDLFLGIILSRDIKESQYATITVSLRSGDRITGVKKEEDAESIKVYDTTELPAVLRTVQKENISRIEYVKDSVMPTDYASSYTIKQLLDIVTFLKFSQTKSRVMLKDLFQ